ncbi:metallophosphoesterase [Salinirubellus sp. GCM10025818]|jgi:putative phosphoesterase|uniref:metallophosphoesterase n=1 Tax=Salinirubellus TaxID=2162630 RepID=UPI0030D48028
MLVVVSDTHGRSDHRLEGRTLEAVREADLVLHAGDFLTRSVLEAFESEARELRAVYGNNDPTELRERLPADRVVEWGGLRIVVVHGHEHSDTALAMLGRQAMADLVVVGHSHRPGFDGERDPPVLNPGSHADPRWHRPAHAELRGTGEEGRADGADGASVSGRIVEPDGTLLASFEL